MNNRGFGLPSRPMAAARAVREVSTGTPGTDRVQEELARKFGALGKCPLLLGVAVQGVKLTDNKEIPVIHKLGRLPQGVIVTSLTGSALAGAIRIQTDTNGKRTWDDKRLTLQHLGTGSVEVDLWVY